MEQEQPSRVGRRLAAIVAADVAGYSRLMGLDEVRTARTLREHRKVTDALVEKHGGRLVKSTGDGVLLEVPRSKSALTSVASSQSACSSGAEADRRASNSNRAGDEPDHPGRRSDRARLDLGQAG
jgi:class 3 adenylate cyclase